MKKKARFWVVISLAMIIAVIGLTLLLFQSVLFWSADERLITDHMSILEDKYTEICYKTELLWGQPNYKGYIRLNEEGKAYLEKVCLRKGSLYQYYLQDKEDGLSEEEKEYWENISKLTDAALLKICEKAGAKPTGWWEHTDGKPNKILNARNENNIDSGGMFYFNEEESLLIFEISFGR